jgi:lysophospholipase L1-like esterase
VPAATGGSGEGRGLVALGDSVTRGSGEAMLGLRMQSWALWLAEALQMPYSCLARDGARMRDVLAEQVPRLRGRYELGCLYAGINDVRTPGFRLEEYEQPLEAVLAVLAQHCERVLIVGLPRHVGVPPAPAWAIEDVGRLLAGTARRHGALLLGLERMPVPGAPGSRLPRARLRGIELVQPDRVHLTARGEVWIALRAAELLAGEGCELDMDALREALQPLAARAWTRYLLGARLPAVLRDAGRRSRERIR